MKLTILVTIVVSIGLMVYPAFGYYDSSNDNSHNYIENSLVKESKGKDNPPSIIVPRDIYIQAKEPTAVQFKILVKDDFDKDLLAECDAVSGQKFKLGKTTVRCIAIDSNGNIGRSSFVVTVGYVVTDIPAWTKTLVSYWTNEMISDHEFEQSMNYLVQSNVIKLPSKVQNTFVDLQPWLKEYSNWWITGKISNDEYAGILSQAMKRV
ncbi:MAG: HYR domain-containing protein [Nitrosopumilaceae archaeon]|nr:HYR domain-containing protein [Nitrosopumilaceae archaeon]NIU88452.1 HYR domain-containing protein [Nitrosopumilaceae archaeon]NIV66699.1 HYR domain-containing protein [Nitrosopumilaceae archaeon]NIX62644.1 HYR domain-containing protein [Nitrosopumilaceae archaeon]